MGFHYLIHIIINYLTSYYLDGSFKNIHNSQPILLNIRLYIALIIIKMKTYAYMNEMEAALKILILLFFEVI